MNEGASVNFIATFHPKLIILLFLSTMLGCVVENDADSESESASNEVTADGSVATDTTVEAENDAGAETSDDDGGECVVDGECGSPLQACRDGYCLDRCFGGTCFRGGVCQDGVCYPEECREDSDCGENEICRDEACIERVSCESNDDCSENQSCEEELCEPLPRCVGDRNCAGDEICERGFCRVRPDCSEDESICGEGEACIGDRCVPSGCRGVDDCEDGEACIGGECRETPPPAVERVVILTAGRALSPGMNFRLQAVGLNARGQIVTTSGFDWASSNALATHAGDGVFTAGLDSGSFEITAQFVTSDDANEITLTSNPVEFSIIPAAPEDVPSVRVVDQLGQPVADAFVVSGGITRNTDEDGVAVFEDDTLGQIVTVFANGFDYATLVRADCSEVLVPLMPRTDLTNAAGLEGVVSFDRIVNSGEIDTSLTGAAITRGILGLSLERLIGRIFFGRVSLLGQDRDIPLPGGLTLSGQVPILGEIDLKNRFYVETEPGIRVLWSFAGRLDFQTLFSFAQGGGFDLGQVLTIVLPFFETFSHGLKTLPNVQTAPTIVDEDDLDGDGDTTELRADYTGNPEVRMSPTVSQDLRLQVNLPENLNDIGEVAVLFMGAEVPEIGFVPLGVTAADEPGAIPARMALPYGPIAGGEVTAIAATTTFQGGDSILPTDLSVLVRRFDGRVPTEINFERGFLGYDRDFEFDASLNALSASPSSGGNLSRWRLQGAEVGWVVNANGVHNVDIVLPSVPDGFPSLGPSPQVIQESIDLDITQFSILACPSPAGTLQDIDNLTIGYSRSGSD